MTHPDILKMQLDGFLALPPHTVGECDVCGDELHNSDEYYNVHDDMVCDNCIIDYIRQFKAVGV